MKALFLDIDGVLNIGGKQKLKVAEPHLISKLNQIVDDSTSVILISSWGLYLEVNEISEFLVSKGFKGEVSEYLFGEESRKEKILEWIKNNNPDSFVTLDDRDLGDSINLIQVNPNIGLSDNNVREALTYLSKIQ